MNILIILNWCYGISRPYSPVFCSEVHQVGHQIKMVAPFFDRTLVINDVHDINDSEFEYLPPHNLTASDIHPLDIIAFSNPQILYKNTLNAFAFPHNRGVLEALTPKNVLVTGFNASTDIIPTCLGLIDMQMDTKIMVSPECIGDLYEERKSRAIEYLGYIGIPRYDKSVMFQQR
jgi:hypothetical protein